MTCLLYIGKSILLFSALPPSGHLEGGRRLFIGTQAFQSRTMHII